ncbi:MAG: BNR-4 repeat-containing protein [Limisphaerales bacterium]
MKSRPLYAVLFILCGNFAQAAEVNQIAGKVTQLNDNGAWSWFMDERAIVDRGQLLVGSVRANGRFEQNELPGWGDVELSVLKLNSGGKEVIKLHEHFEQDDHDNPGLITLPDGHYLAMYSKHGREAKFYYRISTEPGNPYSWSGTREVATPGNAGNFAGDSVTYSNPIYLSAEKKLYMFHRGVGLDPNYLVSDDLGRSWRYGGKLFIGRDGYSAYVKYASNGRDTIHFVATEDHPRNFDNSLFHGFIRNGAIHKSDGERASLLSTNADTKLRPWDLTPIFRGSRTNVAWMCDIQLDSNQHPVVLFTTQRDGAGLPMGAGGMDHRFHYARWDGSRWNAVEIGYAGTRLYPGEDDYTGLGAIDPSDPNRIYISTDTNPKTGAPLISRANFRRHHELFAGGTADGGKTWTWKQITSNSTTDNLRPVVPAAPGQTILCWMRGSYRCNRGEWSTAVMVSQLDAVDLP